jgi:hypothetical protein
MAMERSERQLVKAPHPMAVINGGRVIARREKQSLNVSSPIVVRVEGLDASPNVIVVRSWQPSKM